MKYSILVALLFSIKAMAGPDIRALIIKEANKQDFPADVAVAVAIVESNLGQSPGTNRIRYHDGIGIFQIRATTAKEQCNMTPQDLQDPAKNIRCGIKYLKSKFNKYKSHKLAIASYNSGSPITCDAKRLQKKFKCKPGKLINEHYVTKVNNNIAYK